MFANMVDILSFGSFWEVTRCLTLSETGNGNFLSVNYIRCEAHEVGECCMGNNP